MPNSPFPPYTLTVSGLTDYLQALIETDAQLHRVWVTGEVSSSNQRSMGWFFTLQDGEGQATIACVVWGNKLSSLTHPPMVGEQVTVLGQVRVYAKRGNYQLVVWQVLPAGAGLKALRDRQLRDRLQAEGLFDRDRKRPLPKYVETLAVVTSPQAAAWGDIQRTLQQQHPGLRVLLSPAIVQGESAPRSIAQAIDRVGRDGRAQVVLLARGGGAAEDLDCFNDERVVRAIATSPVPVITGIGHQRDESLADLVADVAAHTPTAAAELAVPALAILQAENCDRSRHLVQLLYTHLDHYQNQLQDLRHRLQRVHPEHQLTQRQQHLRGLAQRLSREVTTQYQAAQIRCDNLQRQLIALDPEAVLQRGYALVRNAKGQLVQSAEQAQPGDRLTIHWADNALTVQVID